MISTQIFAKGSPWCRPLLFPVSIANKVEHPLLIPSPIGGILPGNDFVVERTLTTHTQLFWVLGLMLPMFSKSSSELGWRWAVHGPEIILKSPIIPECRI
jgi:hypothetical protein